jgi:hypothetical protein
MAEKENLLLVIRNIGYLRLINDFIERSLIEKYSIDILILNPGNSKKVNSIRSNIVSIESQKKYFRKILTLNKRIKLSPTLALSVMLCDVFFYSQETLRSFVAPRERILNTYGLASKFYYSLLKIFNFFKFHELINNLRTSLITYCVQGFSKSHSKDLEDIFATNEYNKVLILGVTANIESRVVASICTRKSIKFLSLLASWDNLTTKGQVFLLPNERFITWSSLQIEELEMLHSIRSANAVAIGAYPFMGVKLMDQLPIKEFQKPTVLWLMSSGFIAKSSRKNRYPTLEFFTIVDFLKFTKSVPIVNPFRLEIRVHPSISPKIIDKSIFQKNFQDIANINIEIVVDFPTNSISSENRVMYWNKLASCKSFISLATSAAVEASLFRKKGFMPPGNLSDRSLDDMPHGKYLLISNGGPLDKTSNFEELLERILNDDKEYENTECVHLVGEAKDILHSHNRLKWEIENLDSAHFQGVTTSSEYQNKKVLKVFLGALLLFTSPPLFFNKLIYNLKRWVR